jgi:3-phosphoshikimate 1-carboxyvinyltransferase
VAQPGPLAGGSHRVPGDKSITHRALMLAALARGRTRLSGALTSLDARSTARVLRQLGARISRLGPGATVLVEGMGRLARPNRTLHCGNSGTTARLLLGLLAGQAFAARLSGDASLRRRPMRRVTEPLQAMGAGFPGRADRLPLTIVGGPLAPITWPLPVASAQVKSALLLAGVVGGVPVILEEPGRSRDHTERLLSSFGYRITITPSGLHFEPTGEVTAFDLQIPGDPSSAAFLAAAAVLGRRGLVRIAGISRNPTRIAWLELLARMGATAAIEPGPEAGGEPVGDLLVGPAALRAVRVTAAEVPALIDEIPVLAVLAARAVGESRFEGLAELRHKESDRLALLATNLQSIGVEAEASGDVLIVVGTDRPLAGPVLTAGDHRLAMAFAVLDRDAGLVIDDPGCADVSFPGFAAALAGVRREVA